MKKEIIRWGIIGTGKIANRFASALKNLKDADLIAVASQQEESRLVQIFIRVI